jgi:hypothetical protein
MTYKPTNPDALVPFIRLLLDQVKDLYARCEAMKLVLESHGVLPEAEYAKRRAECLALWDKTLTTEAHRMLQEATDRDWKLLLEKHEGTKQ